MIDLKRFRKDRKLTQQVLANLFGCQVSNVSMMERDGKLTEAQEAIFKKEFGEKIFNEYSIRNAIANQQNKIPYYDIDFMAGTAAVFADVPETPSYHIDINPFNDCDFALPIFGDSMYPQYQNGDIVLCRKINDKSIIPLGEAFLIVTSEHRMLKYLRKGPKTGTLMAVSENSTLFDPFPIEIDKIIKLYQVKGVIKRKAI